MNVRGLIVGLALCALVAGSALAQDGPGSGRPPRGEGPEGRDHDRGPGDRERGPGGMDGGFGRGDGDGMGMGMLPPQMRMFQGYMMMIEQSARMSRDASASGVAAAVMAGDLLRKKGPEAAISYYTGLLPDIKDPTIERAVRFQLVELYKRTNQEEKALGELTRLITGKATTQPSEK
jgi:hypothetical protein